MLQVSGLVVDYDLTKPVGERVVGVRVGEEPLRADRSYTVTTFDFLASGADLYSGFQGASVIRGEGPEFAELLEARFRADEVVAPPPRGRLIEVQ